MSSNEIMLQEMRSMRSEMNKGFRESRNDIRDIHKKIESTRETINERIDATQQTVNEVDKKFINKNWKLIVFMIMIGIGSGGVGSASGDIFKKYLQVLIQ